MTALVGLFHNDVAAQWISDPLRRLTLEVLYGLAFLVLDKGAATKKVLFKSQQLQVALEVLRGISIDVLLSKLIHEAVGTLKAMLVDNTSAVLSAGAKTLFGAVKSLVTMKVDQDLIDGLSKGVMAGFDMYKHCSAEKQLTFMKTLCPALALTDYSEIEKKSNTFKSVDGNW